MGNISEKYVSCSEEETINLGICLASFMGPGTAVSLEGDLGAGKTALVRGIAKGLGIDETITSPTFTIVNTYEGDITLHHFDVYRIDDPEELYYIGWDEYFNPSDVCIVEWGDRVSGMLPDDTMRIRIMRDQAGLNKRIIILERQDCT
jgi:tRNA threonylcarbamoyladenosine biosynthesis protein TsaE